MPRINILTELKQANQNLLNAQAHLIQIEKLLVIKTNKTYYQNPNAFDTFNLTYEQKLIIECLMAGYIENKEISLYLEQKNLKFKSNLKYQIQRLIEIFEVSSRTALLQKLMF